MTKSELYKDVNISVLRAALLKLSPASYGYVMRWRENLKTVKSVLISISLILKQPELGLGSAFVGRSVNIDSTNH